MALADSFKSKAYFKRFQVKFRRRREGKTDYFARKRLIMQDKNKFSTPKYRCIVRLTNKNVIVQFAHSKIAGDVIIASAQSAELKAYGLTVGLTNYAAAYATGLLAARRVLTKFNLAEAYEGNTDKIGDDYTPEETEESERRPFKAFLDVGLARTTTGAKVFAALKGVCDGGVNVPHSDKHFYGNDSEALRKRIFGGHVADYMAELKTEDAAKFKAMFSQYIAAGVTADTLEGVIAACHAGIRADPTKKACGDKKTLAEYKSFKRNPRKLSLAVRNNKIIQRLAAFKAKTAAELAAMSDSESEEEA